ncbi:hypothetical protein LTSEHVI_2541 [Salmonella enterica subsp. enterica serovar Hvittingfoss str. A4-620]|nr:hypothetical protein LTSEHVI_2541 [Salmonella enterica subsp. enterica serovar Hvittingfoss str. A4-620]
MLCELICLKKRPSGNLFKKAPFRPPFRRFFYLIDSHY